MSRARYKKKVTNNKIQKFKTFGKSFSPENLYS